MSRMRKHWLPVYCFYLTGAMVITWPLVTSLGTHLAGYPFTDSMERLHHVWWLTHALRTGQSLFWLPNLGWPDGMAGISLSGQPLQHIPAALLALALPLVVADNLSLLLHIAFMGLGMYALGLHLARGSRPAALVGGLVFMAAPTFQAHLGDGHNVHHSLAFAPLFVLALFRMRGATGRSRWRWFAVGSLSFALVNGGHPFNAIYMLAPLAALLILQKAMRRDWQGLAQAMLVCLTGVLLQLLMVLPVFGETLGNPAYTDVGGDVGFGLDLLAPVTPSYYHPLYGQLEYSEKVLGIPTAERSAWIGLVAGALVLLALVRRRGRFWLAVAIVAWVLALGPLLKLLGEPLVLNVDDHASFVTMPAAILQLLPVVNLDRTPGRFSYLLALAVACLATHGAVALFGLSRLKGRNPRSLLAVLLLVIAILYDYQWFWPFPTRSAVVPAEIANLAYRSDIRAVLDIPVRNRRSDKEALWLQTAHQLPLLGGHVTRNSPANPARLELLYRTLDPALLRTAGADIVIVHRRHSSDRLIERAETRLGPPTFIDRNFAVFETPVTDSTPPISTMFVPVGPTLRLSETRDISVYANLEGWLDLSGYMTASRQDLVILLDNAPVDRWPATSGKAQVQSASLPLWPGTWQMVTLAPDPACPVAPSPVVECSRVALERFSAQILPAIHIRARFAQGVVLQAASLPSQAIAGGKLDLRMHWSFAQGRDPLDVRFVHLLDGDDRLVAQSDEAIGPVAAGGQVSDRVTLSLPDPLPPGEYSVWLGWYRYPEIRRLALIEPAGYEGDIFPLGVVHIG